MNISKRSFLKTALATPALASPAVILASAIPQPAAAAGHAKTSAGPGYHRYRVGDIEITALLDGYFPMPNEAILGFDEPVARQSTKDAYRRFTEGAVTIPVNGYIVKTGDETILIDAGAPTFISPTLGGLKANMEMAGINPADITAVMLTHTHPDHLGALATKEGGKMFKNASLMLSETEWGFITNDEIRGAMPKDIQGAFDYARAAMAPYKEQLKLFKGEKELFTGINSVPLPGHSPGHTGFAIHSGNESLLIWGDVIHLSTLQFANPDWGVVFDADVELAKKTRRSMLDRASTDRMAVAGMHIDFPGIGYVERKDDSFRYVSAPYMPD